MSISEYGYPKFVTYPSTQAQFHSKSIHHNKQQNYPPSWSHSHNKICTLHPETWTFYAHVAFHCRAVPPHCSQTLVIKKLLSSFLIVFPTCTHWYLIHFPSILSAVHILRSKKSEPAATLVLKNTVSGSFNSQPSPIYKVGQIPRITSEHRADRHGTTPNPISTFEHGRSRQGEASVATKLPFEKIASISFSIYHPVIKLWRVALSSLSKGVVDLGTQADKNCFEKSIHCDEQKCFCVTVLCNWSLLSTQHRQRVVRTGLWE